MQNASVETLSLYEIAGSSRTASASRNSVAPALAGIDMLRRGIDAAVDTSDRPDPRYWTAYDYFMVEREARAARTVHLAALCAKGVASLRKWLA